MRDPIVDLSRRQLLKLLGAGTAVLEFVPTALEGNLDATMRRV
jgi:hypothetical protein